MRKAALVAIIVLAATALWLFLRREPIHSQTLYAYFRHVQNVQRGMPVCVDGVQVGSVEKITIRPELGDRPVEVVLTLNTPYSLRIPTGSTAQVAEPGILQPKIVDIDTRTATGPPIQDGGTIEGLESRDDQAAHALGVVVKALVDQSKSQDQQPGTTHDGRSK